MKGAPNSLSQPRPGYFTKGGLTSTCSYAANGETVCLPHAGRGRGASESFENPSQNAAYVLSHVVPLQTTDNYNVAQSNYPSSKAFRDAVNKQTHPTMTFQLQDVITGAMVRFDAENGHVTEIPTASSSIVDWAVLKDPSVYKNDQYAVALQDAATGNCIRHAGFVTWESAFAANNVDFAWVFKRTNRANVYTIFNFYEADYFLGYNNNRLLITHGPPREWQVVGSREACALVSAISSSP